MTKELDSRYIRGGASLLLLAVLSEEPMHGYQLTRHLEEQSKGIFRFREASIYPLLYSLSDQGLVTSRWKVGETGRRRRVYQTTKKGERSLETRLENWRQFVKGMRLCLGS